MNHSSEQLEASVGFFFSVKITEAKQLRPSPKNNPRVIKVNPINETGANPGCNPANPRLAGCSDSRASQVERRAGSWHWLGTPTIDRDDVKRLG